MVEECVYLYPDGPNLSPGELTRICNELISIMESNGETTCTLDSNA
jgi:hypothetical protein